MAQRAGVSFELEGLDLEGDELVVTGHWSGVRGLRFVRPMLVADDRRILATLEHKPWAPSLDRAWIAAFPWDGAEVDVRTLTLAVAPQVTVSLSGAPLDQPPPKPAPETEPAPAPAPVSPIRPLEPTRDEPQPEPELPPAAAAPRRAPRAPRARRVTALEAELQTVIRERDAAQHDRERALAERDEAVAEREAAVRTRARIQLEHDEALQARDSAEAALAVAQAQRDEARAQRDEARAQRDEARAQRDEARAQRDDVLLAYRSLQRDVEAERAEQDRVQDPAPDGEAEPEDPVGARTMSAARTVMAQLQRPATPASRLPLSVLDLWVIRVLGTVAAGCFVLLLISLLRVLI